MKKNLGKVPTESYEVDEGGDTIIKVQMDANASYPKSSVK
jgi:hypothetical protein